MSTIALRTAERLGFEALMRAHNEAQNNAQVALREILAERGFPLDAPVTYEDGVITVKDEDMVQ